MTNMLKLQTRFTNDPVDGCISGGECYLVSGEQ